MQIRAVLALLSALASLACARPSGSTDAQVALGPPQPDSQLVEAAGPPRYRPVVIWHGLGDWYSSEGMVRRLASQSWQPLTPRADAGLPSPICQTELAADLERRFPSLFVYNAHISDDAGKDRNAGFYGNVNEQIEAVADELEALPELADGVRRAPPSPPPAPAVSLRLTHLPSRPTVRRHRLLARRTVPPGAGRAPRRAGPQPDYVWSSAHGHQRPAGVRAQRRKRPELSTPLRTAVH